MGARDTLRDWAQMAVYVGCTVIAFFAPRAGLFELLLLIPLGLAGNWSSCADAAEHAGN